MRRLAPYAKAASALATTFVLTAAAFTGDGGISGAEWLISLAMALGGGGVVFAVPNKPTVGKHERAPVAE